MCRKTLPRHMEESLAKASIAADADAGTGQGRVLAECTRAGAPPGICHLEQRNA